MVFDSVSVAKAFPGLQQEITLNSTTRVLLRTELEAYWEQVLRQYVDTPELLQYADILPDELWLSGKDLREQISNLIEQLAEQIMHMPSMQKVMAVPNGNTIPAYVRSIVSDAMEVALKKILQERQTEP